MWQNELSSNWHPDTPSATDDLIKVPFGDGWPLSHTVPTIMYVFDSRLFVGVLIGIPGVIFTGID